MGNTQHLSQRGILNTYHKGEYSILITNGNTQHLEQGEYSILITKGNTQYLSHRGILNTHLEQRGILNTHLEQGEYSLSTTWNTYLKLSVSLVSVPFLFVF